MSAENEQPVQVTPEDVVLDYLIGEHELEKLKNGFQAPVTECAPSETAVVRTSSDLHF